MVSFRALKLYAYLILGAIVLVTFIPCVGNDFLNWDDYAFVVKNPRISSLSVKSLVWMVTTFYQGVWHPLTWFSHAVDLAVWGAEPSYHHLVSVCIHVVTVLLVFALFVRLQEARGVSRQSAYIAAFTGALLFGVHPLRVESVAWLAERKDVLCALFTVASLVFYLDYAIASERLRRRQIGDHQLPNGNQPCRGGRTEAATQDAHRSSSLLGREPKYYGLSLLCFLLALLSKPMAMTLPLVMIVIDFFPLDRLTSGSARRVLVEKTPFFVLAALAAGLNVAAAAGSSVPLSYVPLYMRTMNAFYAVVFYIKQSVFPQNLLPLYQMDRDLDYFGPTFVLSMALVIAVSAACIWRATKNDRVWAAVWFSYLIALGPALGFFMSFRHAVADRYSYLPTLGFWLLAGLAISRLWELSGTLRQGAVAARVAVIGCVVAAATGYGIHTTSQIGIWKNGEIFWNHILTHADHIPALAFYQVGKELETKGQLDQAVAYYEKALSLDPPNPYYASEIANIISKKGDHEAALARFKEIAAREPADALHQLSIARMYVLMQRYDEAVPALERALKLDPDNGDGLLMLAFIHLNQGDRAKALSSYKRYVAVGYPPRAELEREFGSAARDK